MTLPSDPSQSSLPAADKDRNPIVHQLQGLRQQIVAQSLTSALDLFKGDPKRYKAWIKHVEKFCLLQGIGDDAKTKMLITYQASEGPVSDFIERFLASGQEVTFDEFKDELKARFGGVSDESQSMVQLRKMRQKQNETVQAFGERLIQVAQEAFPDADLDNPIITRQLIEFFIDGMIHNGIAKKLIREGPKSFHDAVLSATNEQNILARFQLRGRQEEPMEIGRIEGDKRTETRTCFFCNERGHIVRFCPKKRKGGPKICYHCRKPGHIRPSCPLLAEQRQQEN